MLRSASVSNMQQHQKQRDRCRLFILPTEWPMLVFFVREKYVNNNQMVFFLVLKALQL
jgi:hypothetical protein